MSRITRLLVTVPVLVALGTGCQLNIERIPTGRPDEMGSDSGRPRDASASTPEAGAEAGVEAGVDASASERWRAGIRHASCDQAVPDDVPAEPISALADPLGRAPFDAWRSIACAEVATFPTCSQYDGADHIDCTQCLGAADEASGVCAAEGVLERASCVQLHDLTRDCWACVAPEAKARACCAGLDVDCHTLSDGPGALGQPCRRHRDCEPGLLCSDGIPVCTCPGPPTDLPECEAYRSQVLP